jgi:hypothetical protein
MHYSGKGSGLSRRQLQLSLLIWVASASFAVAADRGFDHAGNAPYGDGWQTGDNGGTGFGAWTLSLTNPGSGSQNGHFIGAGNGSINANENSSFGTSWALYANSGQTASAVRPFSGGALSLGQTFGIAMDNGGIDTGGTVGLGLQNSSGTNRLEFFFVGGQSSYVYNNGSSTSTGISFRDNGLRVFVTPLNASNVRLVVTSAGGTGLFDNTVTVTNATDISQVRLFNFNAGGGDSRNLFFDELSTPEPGVLSLFVGLALVAGGRPRRRSRLAV